MSDSGSNGSLFLSGETVESWRALSLRDLWTVQDTKLFLKTGQNRYATASGNMADVIMHSTQHVSDDDLLAIASYLKSLPAGPNDKPMPASTEKLAVVAHVPDNLFSTRGGLGYISSAVTVTALMAAASKKSSHLWPAILRSVRKMPRRWCISC